jgi:hypothetical protein
LTANKLCRVANLGHKYTYLHADQPSGPLDGADERMTSVVTMSVQANTTNHTHHTHRGASTLAPPPPPARSHRWDSQERIATVIRASGIPLATIAERVGVTPRRVRAWCREDLPTRAHWERLCRVIPDLREVPHEPRTAAGTWPLAIHEAAHAVVGWVRRCTIEGVVIYGLDLDYPHVTISADPCHVAPDQWDPAIGEHLMAGVIAELRWRGGDQNGGELADHIACGRRLRARPESEWQREAERAVDNAAAWVRELAASIQAVAAALVARSYVDGGEVEEIVRKTEAARRGATWPHAFFPDHRDELVEGLVEFAGDEDTCVSILDLATGVRS